MQNIINNIKRNYLLSIIVIGLIVLSLYSTFAMFTASVNTNDIVNLTASNLPTGTETIEYERLTIKAGEKKTIEFTVKNSTSGSLYYGAWYEMIKPTSITDDIQIAKQQNTQNDSLGQLSKGSSAKVSLIIVNDSSSSIIVNIGVAYSSTSSMNLPTNRYLITETYSPGDLIINTTDTNKFNNKGNYDISVNCSNATARWDYTNWKLVVSSLSGTTCNPTFTDRSDNLSQFIIDNVGTEQGEGQIVNEIVDNSTFTPKTKLSQSEYLNLNNDSTYPFSWNSTTNSWTSTNVNNSTTGTITFTLPKAGEYQFCYLHSFTSFAGEDYATIYLNGTEIFNLNGIDNSVYECKYLGNLKTSDIIKVTYSKDGILYFDSDKIDFYLQNVTKEEDIISTSDYRYEGKDPNNYVLFNGELWRIIGVFDSTTHGVSGNLTKIIRNESIGTYAWDKNASSNWSNASLKTILNDFYYNSTNGTGNASCYLAGTYMPGNCDFRYTGLDITSRNMIQQVTWKLGGYDGLGATASLFYDYERNNPGYGSNPTNVKGYIGLMYPSDYGYSVLANSCSRTTTLDKYSSSICGGQSWLLKYTSEWTMTPYTIFEGNAYSVYDNANISTTQSTRYANVVRPTVYLKSSVYIVSGDGSQGNPYVLGN